MTPAARLTVSEGRPYPPTGIDSATWRTLPVERVPVASLTTTQRHLDLEALLYDVRMPWSNDLPNVVEHDGRRYLEDGHHRVARAILGGASTVDVRVFRR